MADPEKEESVEGELKAVGKKETPRMAKSVIAGVAAGLIVVAAGVGAYSAFSPSASYDSSAGLGAPVTSGLDSDKVQVDSTDEHEHNWVEVYGLAHHDAVTHEVEHPAAYASETSYHTVCNECRQIIDGKADDHIAKTGHSGYSTNVPIVNEVLVSQGWTETVVDEEAHDELVITGEKCSICGEVRLVETQDTQEV